MDKATVQVFIPTFNRRQMLEKAILSVLNQSYPALEIAVLDNASTDGTQSFMEALVEQDVRVKYHRNLFNSGMTSNFNRISPLVTQPFFCVLTDDDVYELHFVSTAMTLFDEYPSAGFVGTNAPIQKDGKVVNVMLSGWEEGFHKKGSKIRECSQSKHPLFTHCIFRSFIAPEFIFHDSIRMVADGHLLTCLATKYDMAISKVITGYWNIHGENETAKQKWNPDIYINALVSRNKLYTEFCKANQLPNKLTGFYKKKLLIGLLHVGRKKECFSKMVRRPDVREIFSPIVIRIIGLLCAINFLDFSLSVKAQLRKIGMVR